MDKLKANLKKKPVMGSLLYVLGVMTGAELPPESIPVLSDLFISWL